MIAPVVTGALYNKSSSVFLLLLAAAAACGINATSVTVDVNVPGCNANPNYLAVTFSVFASNNCKNRNGGPIGDTFYFQGYADNFKSCQGPTIWYPFGPLLNETSNETLPQVTQTQIWVKTNAVLKTNPCSAPATFQFYTDSACTTPYNLVESGNFLSVIQGDEDPSSCQNRTNSPYGSPDWRLEIGSYTISAATSSGASFFLTALALAASAALTRFS